MKKKLIDILLLRKLDRYLLKNYPAIWQTRGHLILFYSLLINIPLFLYGYSITSTKNLTVPPIRQLFLNNDDSFIICFVISLLFILYWLFIQYKATRYAINVKALFTTSLIYLVCISCILIFNTTAYRLGTIHKSKNLISSEDIKLFELNNNYFCVPIQNGPLNQQVSKELRDFETKILKNRYDLKLLLKNKHITQILKHKTTITNIDSKGLLSYLAYIMSLTSLSEPVPTNSVFIKSDLNYRTYLTTFTTIKNIRLENDYTLNWKKLNENNNNSKLDESYLQQLKKQLKLFNYTCDSIQGLLPDKLLSKYQIERNFNIGVHKNFSLKHYPHLFKLEDLTRSTKHANQYLEERIWYKNIKMLLPYVLFFSIVLGLSGYFRLDELVIGILIMALGLSIFGTFKEILNEVYFNQVFLTYFVCTIVLFVFCKVNQKVKSFYYHLLFLVLLVFGLLLYNTGVDLSGFNFILVENNWQLYRIPFICVFIGLLAMWFIHQKPWAR